MNRLTAIASLVLAASTPTAAARADTAKFDAAMQPLLAEYVKIHQSLAGDTDRGVPTAAKKIAALAAKLDPRTVSGEHAAHYKDLPAKIKDAANKLARAKGLQPAREAFKELSRPLAMWATMSRPPGVNVIFCSMAKASWLQQDAKIRNPYYGKKMLTCGEIVSGPAKGKADGQMKMGHH